MQPEDDLPDSSGNGPGGACLWTLICTIGLGICLLLALAISALAS